LDERARAKLSQDGFAIVEKAIALARVDELTSALMALNPGYGRRNLLRECPEVAQLARELQPFLLSVLGPGAFAVRGLFFDKLQGANWDVGWHQDLSIAVVERREVPGFSGWSIKKDVLHVQPPAAILDRMLTARIHLDDCGPDNGPLQVLPGSHRAGRLSETDIDRWKTSAGVTCCLGRGGLLLLRPLLLHASAPAQRPSHRRVIHLEYAADPLPGGLRWYETD
jgi:ectoine hydroxylase-related dioxygenase (phytanoyl-CoA dioxygenase family)